MSTIALPSLAAPSTEKSADHAHPVGESTSLGFVAAVFGTVLMSYFVALFVLH